MDNSVDILPSDFDVTVPYSDSGDFLFGFFLGGIGTNS